MFNYLNRVSQFAFFFFACSNHFWVITRLFSSPQFYFGESINPPSARPLVGQGGQNSTAHALIPSSIKEIGSLPPSMDGYAKTVAALRTISFEYQVTRAVTSGCEKMRPLVLYDRKGVCWCMSKGKFGGPSPSAAWQPKGQCGDCREITFRSFWSNGGKMERFAFDFLACCEKSNGLTSAMGIGAPHHGEKQLEHLCHQLFLLLPFLSWTQFPQWVEDMK